MFRDCWPQGRQRSPWFARIQKKHPSNLKWDSWSWAFKMLKMLVVLLKRQFIILISKNAIERKESLWEKRRPQVMRELSRAGRLIDMIDSVSFMWKRRETTDSRPVRIQKFTCWVELNIRSEPRSTDFRSLDESSRQLFRSKIARSFIRLMACLEESCSWLFRESNLEFLRQSLPQPLESYSHSVLITQDHEIVQSCTKNELCASICPRNVLLWVNHDHLTLSVSETEFHFYSLSQRDSFFKSAPADCCSMLIFYRHHDGIDI